MKPTAATATAQKKQRQQPNSSCPHPSPAPPHAQNGAQHTVASLLGLGLSVWFARAVSVGGSASGSRVWGWYAVLTMVHLLANYAAMRTLALRSLNPTRASLLVTEYLGQVGEGGLCG